MKRKRIPSIDIAKGFGIILIVFGHIQDNFGADFGIFRSFLNLFHVPMFFFLSGLFFRESDKVWDFIKKKFKRLYLPFLLANLFFFIIEYSRARILGDAYDGSLGIRDLLITTAALLPIPSYFAGQTWFLIVLFRICVLYKCIDKLCRSNIALGSIVALSFLGIGLATDVNYYVSKTLLYFAFYHLGRVCFHYESASKFIFNRKTALIAIVPSILILLYFSIIQPFDIHNQSYGCIPVYLAGTLVGIGLSLWFGEICAASPVVSKIFSNIGTNTLTILIFHNFTAGVLFKLLELCGYPCISNPTPIISSAVALLTIAILTISGMSYSKIKTRILAQGD